MANTVDLGSGLKINTSANIQFPATQVPDADPNTLDDYEEALWTPAIAFGGASVGITYSTQSGTLTKIGNRIMGECRLDLTSKGSSTGVLTITGLPVVPSRDVAGEVFMAGTFAGLTSKVQVLIVAGVSTIFLYLQGTTGAIQLDNTNFASTTSVRVSFNYPV